VALEFTNVHREQLHVILDGLVLGEEEVVKSTTTLSASSELACERDRAAVAIISCDFE
jgi:hypothetical protein